MIVQQLLEDVVGQGFPTMVKNTVLEPWGMRAATFESPLPEYLRPFAASGHRADGSPIPGGWHTYPEMASGASSWATPSDLAQFAVHVMRSYLGQADEVVSQEMAVRMLTPQIDERGPWARSRQRWRRPVLLHAPWRERWVQGSPCRLSSEGTRRRDHDEQR